MDIEEYYLKDHDILGLIFEKDNSAHIFYFRIDRTEPSNFPYSFGSISASGNSGWIDLQDSSTNTYFLEPDDENVINHFFYGISPSRAEVYFQYPKDVDRWKLFGSRAVGSQHGVIFGWESPYRHPHPKTEFITVYGKRPAMNVYNPTSSAQTIRVMFYARTYRVEIIESPTPEEFRRAIIKNPGGKALIVAPDWLKLKYGHKPSDVIKSSLSAYHVSNVTDKSEGKKKDQ